MRSGRVEDAVRNGSGQLQDEPVSADYNDLGPPPGEIPPHLSPTSNQQPPTTLPFGSPNGHAPDIASVIFGIGLQWLVRSTGKPEGPCRSILGKWRKQAGDEALVVALGRAQREGPIDAIAWMERTLKPKVEKQGWNG